MDQVDVDGLTIAYERAGSGPLVLLLHGYVGDGPSVWRHQIDGLASDFTVVAWNAPGVGASSDPPEAFGIDGYAECLAGFVDSLGLGPAHIIGLSFGGSLALAFQRRYRARTKTLVLVSAYAGWRGSLDRDAAEARLAQALRLSRQSPEDLVDSLLPTMFASPVSPEDLAALRAAIADFHPAGLRAMSLASAEDVSDVLGSIAVPTLLVCGDSDVRAPLPVAERLHAAIGSSRLVVLEGAGHVCNVELPDRFNDEVRRFLANCETGSPDGSRPDN